MSITGAADGPPFRLGVAIADIVSGHVRRAGHRAGAVRARAHRTRPGAWTSRCSIRSRRCSPIRPASISRPARRRRASATGIRRSCRTKRSPPPTAISCSPSATTSSGGSSAASPDSSRTSAFATNRQRVISYDELRPFDRRQACGRSRGALDRTADRRRRAVRIGSRPARSCSRIRSSPPRDMIARVEHAAIGPLRLLGVPVKLSDTPGAVRTRAADARPAHRRRARERSRHDAAKRSPNFAREA